MLRWIIATLCIGVVCMGACIQSDPDLTGWKCKGDADCGTARTFRCETSRNICLGVCVSQADCKPTERCEGGLCLPECTHECVKSAEPSSTEFTPDAAKQDISLSDTPLSDASEAIAEAAFESADTLPEALVETPVPPELTAERADTSPADLLCVPGKEICDGKDNNCNDRVDEEFVEKGRPCVVSGAKGVCATGVFTDCLNGKLVCTGPSPSAEVCDGKDNDCDGSIDEEFPNDGASCQVSGVQGLCSLGVVICQNGQEVCKQVTLPQAEVCGDGKDNNCDGQIDENPPCVCSSGSNQTCFSGRTSMIGVGICRAGTQTCQGNSSWGACLGEVPPAKEVCDGKDNNCDGVIDENCPCNYLGKADGVCGQVNRNAKGDCVKPPQYSQAEICGDGLDNNCDGAIDEGCPCNYLNKTKGVCSTATRDAKGTCSKPANYNVKEICGDGLDNNCNGMVDKIDASDQCFSYAKGCLFTNISPAGAKDVCTVVNYQCSQSNKLCPGPTTPPPTMCPSSPGVVSCFSQADCSPCSAALGGNFSCAYNVCIRHAP